MWVQQIFETVTFLYKIASAWNFTGENWFFGITKAVQKDALVSKQWKGKFHPRAGHEAPDGE